MILRIGKSSRSRNKGFVLIELVLVAAIILVLAGLAIPLFGSPFRDIQLKDTSQNLVQLMRYVQAKAIAERKFCRINFDFAKGIFWPTVESDTHSGEFSRIKGKRGKAHNLAPDISIAGKSAFVTFYPDGSSDQAKIEISHSRGKAFTITTPRYIGDVKIEE